MLSILQSKSKKKNERKCCFIPGTRFFACISTLFNFSFKIFIEITTLLKSNFHNSKKIIKITVFLIKKKKRLYLKVCNPFYRNEHRKFLGLSPGGWYSATTWWKSRQNTKSLKIKKKKNVIALLTTPYSHYNPSLSYNFYISIRFSHIENPYDESWKFIFARTRNLFLYKILRPYIWRTLCGVKKTPSEI